LEETTIAQRSLLATLAGAIEARLYALEEPPAIASERERERAAELVAWFAATHPEGETPTLERIHRDPPRRFWRCAGERAQAQAVARETEHLLAAGVEPGAICVALADPGADGGAVAAAMEERGIPFHLGG